MIGGVSVQFQKYNDVTLAIIRSGVGLRLGANIGYLHYTRSPLGIPFKILKQHSFALALK